MREAISRLLRESKLPGIALIAVLIGLWQLAFTRNWIVAVGFRPPTEIASALWNLMTTGEIPAAVGLSLMRMFIGYGIAAACGIFCGILMGYYRPLYNLLEPTIESLRPIPSPAYIPIVLIFLGVGNQMMIFMIAFGSVWAILLNTYSGVVSLDPVQAGTAKTFGHRDTDIIRKVTLPAAAPQIMTGMRISLAVALIIMVLSEMLAGNNGIGYAILNYQRTYRIAEMYAAIVILGALGYFLNWSFLKVERRLIGWHYGATAREK